MVQVPNRDNELPEPGREYDPQSGENFGELLNAVIIELSGDLSNAESGLDGHDHTGDTISPAEAVIGDQNPDPADYPIAALSIAGVTIWVGDEVTDAMADTDVFIDVSQ